MYGEQDDPYAVLSRLGQQLEGTLAAEAVLPLVVETVTQALRLPYAAIAIEQQGTATLTAAAGSPAGEILTLPLIHRDETVGRLVVAPRVGERSFSAADRRLLEDLARQAGTAAHAIRLSAELQRSRERLVTARAVIDGTDQHPPTAPMQLSLSLRHTTRDADRRQAFIACQRNGLL